MAVDLIFEFLNKKNKYGVRNRSVVLLISMMVTMISVILFKLRLRETEGVLWERA